ncbi:MAG: hypothetical protein JZU65_23780 [Chlorobium sp.]|nr:hypothetical protein [Chlorobium sp.]
MSTIKRCAMEINDECVTLVVTGASYAMSIYVSILQNDAEIHISNDDEKRLDGFLAKMLNCRTVTTAT